MKIIIGKEYDPNASYKLMKHHHYQSEIYREIAEGYDDISTITNKVAYELKEVCDFDNYVIGIHRTGYSNVTPEFLDDVFQNGLINNGHSMLGVQDDYMDLERTVSIISDFTLLVGVLKTGHNYKNSQGMLLVKIPKEYVDKKSPNRKPIYFRSEVSPRLLPEYIYGYIPSDREGNITEIIHNENYRDVHDYENDGLLYEGDNKRSRNK